MFDLKGALTDKTGNALVIGKTEKQTNRMSKACFGKELCSNIFYVAGAPVPFETLPGNHGVISLEIGKDDNLIAALNKAADASVGGIYRMTEAEFAQKKIAAASAPLTQPRRKEMLRQMPTNPLLKRKSDAAAAALGVNAVPPRPETVPLTDAALKKASAPVLHEPVPPFATESSPASPEPASDVPVEGFRPATRRIKRRSATAEVAA